MLKMPGVNPAGGSASFWMGDGTVSQCQKHLVYIKAGPPGTRGSPGRQGATRRPEGARAARPAARCLRVPACAVNAKIDA